MLKLKVVLVFMFLFSLVLNASAVVMFERVDDKVKNFHPIEDRLEKKRSEKPKWKKEKLKTTPAKAYYSLKPSHLELENALDPYEQQDNYEYYRSPYPLIRTNQALFSQKTSIPPGYYLLTPRKIGAKNYIFFKQKGKVLYSVPVYQIDDVVMEDCYPQPKEPYAKFPWGVRHVVKFLNIMLGRYTPPIKVPEHKLECFVYNDDYYGIDIYYKDKLYRTIYRFEKDDTYL